MPPLSLPGILAAALQQSPVPLEHQHAVAARHCLRGSRGVDAQPLRGDENGKVYVNFLMDEGKDSVRAAYGPEKYERLAANNRRYDPTTSSASFKR